MRQRDAGFTLVELMVGITLGLLLTGAVISVFVGSRTAYQATSGTGALADSGRFALDMIQAAARGAGFLACSHTNTLKTGTENLLAAAPGSPLPYDFSHAISGYEATGTSPGGTLTLAASPPQNAANSNWTPTLDSTFGSATTQAQVLGSDVLVLRSSAPKMQPAYLSTGITAGALSFTALNAGQLQASQLAVISDCSTWFTFQIGAVTAGTPATITLSGGNTGGIPVGMVTGAVITPVTTVVYYIGVGSDNYPGLRRLELIGGSTTFTDEELVPDIDNMQVLYGVDTTGTQTASEYVTADQVTNFDAVVSIKVAVLSASPLGSAPKPAAALTYNLLNTTVTAPIDTRARQVFAITVGVRDALQ